MKKSTDIVFRVQTLNRIFKKSLPWGTFHLYISTVAIRGDRLVDKLGGRDRQGEMRSVTKEELKKKERL